MQISSYEQAIIKEGYARVIIVIIANIFPETLMEFESPHMA